MVGTSSEHREAFEILLKVVDRLREKDVPEEKYEMLWRTANNKIRDYKDIEEILQIINRLCDFL